MVGVGVLESPVRLVSVEDVRRYGPAGIDQGGAVLG
jgi:hypothetical protein